MAQITETRLIDDIDGGDADETVTFALDGRQYEIDLSTKNAEELRNGLVTFVAAARRTGGQRSGSRKAPRSTSDHPAAVRAWAQANGHEVSNRGRVPKDIEKLYEQRDRQPAVAQSTGE